jgi:hypothetical protein
VAFLFSEDVLDRSSAAGSFLITMYLLQKNMEGHHDDRRNRPVVEADRTLCHGLGMDVVELEAAA